MTYQPNTNGQGTITFANVRTQQPAISYANTLAGPLWYMGEISQLDRYVTGPNLGRHRQNQAVPGASTKYLDQQDFQFGFRCSVCGERFGNTTSINRHILRLHAQSPIW